MFDIIAEVEARKGAWWRAVEDATNETDRKEYKLKAYICDAFLSVVRGDDPQPTIELMLAV